MPRKQIKLPILIKESKDIAKLFRLFNNTKNCNAIRFFHKNQNSMYQADGLPYSRSCLLKLVKAGILYTEGRPKYYCWNISGVSEINRAAKIIINLQSKVK